MKSNQPSKAAPKTGAENILWDLSDLYKGIDDPQFLEDQTTILSRCQAFSECYRGRIAFLSAPEFKQMLQEYESIQDAAGKLGSFTYLLWSTDTQNPAYGKAVQASNELGAKLSQLLVFFRVEWLALDENKAQDLIQADELSAYTHYLETSRAYKPYSLSEEQEQILSAKSVTGQNAWVRYFDETLGSAKFLYKGEEKTEQEVLSLLHHPDRNIRQEAHASLSDGFQKLSRTLTYIFNTLLADKASNDELRGYPSWISSRNLANETDEATVQALVDSVTGYYPWAQRYYTLKSKLLNISDFKDFDRYAPIKKSETTVSWEEAKNMVLEAYDEFHPEMGAIAQRFFDEQWIDAAIRPGKRGGAYSAGTVPSVHPYVFMNYDGRLRDVQTLAHELGHGVHQYLSRKQGALQSGTPLTTAETASVFGEMLVFQKLLKQLDDPMEELSLLMGKIDDTIATVFRQISMNRFEEAMHNARRTQGELTTEQFSELWRTEQVKLYGDSVELTPEYSHWWCYIPHFLHTPGYVYAYAFGELLVLALYEEYQRKPEGFADRYMKLLEAGGSEWPHELVGNMGLNIQDPNFWQKGLKAFEQMIVRAEELYQKEFH
jgi:oligoendopeptidase F